MARGALLLVYFVSNKYCHGWFFIIFFMKIEMFYLIIICILHVFVFR